MLFLLVEPDAPMVIDTDNIEMTIVPAVAAQEEEKIAEANTRTHGTRASTRSAAKKGTVPTAMAAPAAVKSVPSTVAVKEEPVTQLRQLSPRKAAQKHLFVQNRRGPTGVAEFTRPPPSPTKSRSSKSTSIPSDSDVAVQSDSQESVVSEAAATNNENKPVNNSKAVNRRPKRPYATLEDVPPDVLQPLLRLSPPPNGRDYCFNLGDNEGASDLFS